MRSAAKEKAAANRPAEASGEAPAVAADKSYVLDEQVGFILRQVHQRHTAIFANRLGHELTPTQWAALARLFEVGRCTQNLLGRLTAMDVATIKGVVDRLALRGLAETGADPANRRRLLVQLTPEGRELVEALAARALQISEETLAPLSAKERATLITLLKKLR